MQRCLTKKGVVQCSCNSGYQLADDGRTCTGQLTSGFYSSTFIWGGLPPNFRNSSRFLSRSDAD